MLFEPSVVGDDVSADDEHAATAGHMLRAFLAQKEAHIRQLASAARLKQRFETILREVDVSHPAAKSMIELSRAQEEEVGDGTTSVIVLAGEYLARSEPLLERQIHPTVICNGYLKALDDAVKFLDELATPLDLNNREVRRAEPDT